MSATTVIFAHEVAYALGIPTERTSPDPSGPTCMVCGRPTYDPDKRERPWARGVAAGRQVLVCPSCQHDRPDWVSLLDTCPHCGSPRLGVMLGEIVCRACGRSWPA